MNNKYNFIKLNESSSSKILLCPSCLEMLNQIDIETFHECPYCNHSLETFDNDIEDYMLKPVVDNWVTMNNGISYKDLFSQIKLNNL